MLPLFLFSLEPVWAENPSLPLSVALGVTSSKQSLVTTYDFGSRSGFQPAPLTHVFVYRNSTPLPQAITELRPACGCTSALLGEAALLPYTLLPDQTVSVRMTLDPAHLPPGPVTKAVWVYVKGQYAPAATLEMSGTILPVASLTPAALDFGQRTFGSSGVLPLSVTWNTYMLPNGSQCRLVSTNPEVLLTPTPQNAGADNLPQTFQCSLSPQAHLGELEGSIEAIVTIPGVDPVVVGSASLRGDIRGDVAATPAVAAFSIVPRGQSATRELTLTLMQPETLTVSTASPFLTAQLHPMLQAQPAAPFGAAPSTVNGNHQEGKDATSSLMLLTLTLSAAAPSGPLETELTVTTRSGQRLRVPVFALVVPPEAKP